MTPRINSGASLSDTGFVFLGSESAFGMNPGACILDAFGQAVWEGRGLLVPPLQKPD
ncbi:hypothetical protein [Microcoleus sp. Pol12B5]|uniref:hypothetical protein n=1 Tax=Microcoleus sp. Pol12B5 TaxID=3055396 RepID=UPI002FD14C1E